MRTTVQKWGNSLAVRIPATFCKEINLINGSIVEINLDNDFLVFKPLKKKYILTDILDMVNDSNLHEEVKSGEPRDREIW